MNTLRHREQDEDVRDRHSERLEDRHPSGDREITLGTTMILGIFFGLAVLCGVFFGFGYSMGHRSAVPSASVAENATAASFPGLKPSPGSPVGSEPSLPATTLPYSGTAGAIAPTPLPRALPPPARPPTADESDSDGSPSAIAATGSTTAQPTASSTTPVSPTFSPIVASATGQTMVQVAAVSHTEDADLLVSTLKRRGYNVAIRAEPQDKLLHVQMGPFAGRKEAEAIRQRLLADGFNAIIK